MTLFCTEEWAEEFVDLLNNNKESEGETGIYIIPNAAII